MSVCTDTKMYLAPVLGFYRCGNTRALYVFCPLCGDVHQHGFDDSQINKRYPTMASKHCSVRGLTDDYLVTQMSSDYMRCISLLVGGRCSGINRSGKRCRARVSSKNPVYCQGHTSWMQRGKNGVFDFQGPSSVLSDEVLSIDSYDQDELLDHDRFEWVSYDLDTQGKLRAHVMCS